MIKKISLILFCCVLGSAVVLATTFDTANEKFKAGDFAGAATSYEEVLTNDGPRASVFYNLGNSYFQLKNMAQRFWPMSVRF